MYIMPLSIKNGFKQQFIYLLVFQQLAGRRLSGLLPAGWQETSPFKMAAVTKK